MGGRTGMFSVEGVGVDATGNVAIGGRSWLEE
jgi:hypothetical protein